MKYFIYILIFGAIFSLSSCEKSDFNKEDEKLEKDYKDVADKDKSCFDLVYPISYEMPDGTIVSIESKEDWQLLKDWYEMNQDVAEKALLIYPIQIEYAVDKESSKIVDIENEEALIKAKDACDKKDYEKKDCFVLLLPVTYALANDDTITITDENDWKTLKDWYAENEDSAEKPALLYPVEVKFLESSVVKTIASEMEMLEVKKACN